MPGLFQLCKGSWESFSLTFQKCNLPRAGGHQRWSGDNQTPPNPNPGSLPSTKNKNKIKKPNPTNEWERSILYLWINMLISVWRVSQLQTTASFNSPPLERKSSGTGSLIKTKCFRLTPWRREMWSKPPILHQVTSFYHHLPLQFNTADHIQQLLRWIREVLNASCLQPLEQPSHSLGEVLELLFNQASQNQCKYNMSKYCLCWMAHPQPELAENTDAHLEEPMDSYFWSMFLLCHVFV